MQTKLCDALLATWHRGGGQLDATGTCVDCGRHHIVEHPGPWWCVSCSREYPSTFSTNRGEPCCPHCGTILEPQGEGDDDPNYLLRESP